jgi:phosphonate transport system permease protein
VTAVAAVRPAPPRRAAGLLLPFSAVVVGYFLGATTASYAAGALWGLLGAAGLILGLQWAKLRLHPLEVVGLLISMAAATSLTTRFLPDLPELITPTAVLRLAGYWLSPGLVSGILVARRSSRSAGANVALLWAGAGALIAPMAVGFGYLEAGTGEVAMSVFMVASFSAALVGGGATVAGTTGVRGFAVGAVVVAITVFAAAQVGFSIFTLIENIANIQNIPNFWPPDFEWAIGEGSWWWFPSWDFGAPLRPSPLVETFRIGVLASVFGCAVALPISFMASKVTAPSQMVYMLDKSFMNVIRTIPDLFWAMLFVAGVGGGAFAGVLALFFFTLAIMSKLFSETIDSVDTGPLEAAKATGGSHFPAVRVSVLPQVLPNYVAYSLYVFEISIRASVVLGLVGAGGIGRVLEAQRAFFRFDRVLAIVIMIFILVFIIEQVSVAFRRRLV